MKDKNEVREEFFDLYMKFRRNRVWLKISNTDEMEEEDEERLHSLLESRVVNSLEQNCSGFWTAERQEENVEENTISLFFMFEHEQDLETFLRTDGLMLRLEA